jgi:superfamily II DNA/RNA helicase
LSESSFADLGLSQELLRAIAEVGYTEPTPIQEKVIPHILFMRDLIGLAQTGTGKTAGYVWPMLDVLATSRSRARMPRGLILAPTRELAAQVADNFDNYAARQNLTRALLVGGEMMNPQIKALQSEPDVIIATPGRLIDMFDRGHILLNDIRMLVIDEADRMLDMGFIPDIRKIITYLPVTRQTLLFSATMPDEISKLTSEFMINPRQISVKSQTRPAAETVDQFLKWVPAGKKMAEIRRIIDEENVANAFIFCNRKRDVDQVAKDLRDKGYHAAGLHGDMTQEVRTDTLQKFKDGEFVLLVCSDVAARGIDVSDVSHVFNYDIPSNSEDYIHRIGRTGRAGARGRAWALAAPGADDKYVDAIRKQVGHDRIQEYGDEGSNTGKSEGNKVADKNAGKSGNRRGGQNQKSGGKGKGPPKRKKGAVNKDSKPAGKPDQSGKSAAGKSNGDTAKKEADHFTEDDVPGFLKR